MVRYVEAIYRGNLDTEYLFVRRRSYPLAVKTRWWSSRVSVYKLTGYYDDMHEGSFHEFSNWDLFEDCWTIVKIKEVE